ncbi:MAG: hypothetical protein MSS94_09780 [Clostridiales bacterium]|nr:hypothetical protein [Clostridiales bacterium]
MDSFFSGVQLHFTTGHAKDNLIPGVDSFRKLTQQEITQEQSMTMGEMKL